MIPTYRLRPDHSGFSLKFSYDQYIAQKYPIELNSFRPAIWSMAALNVIEKSNIADYCCGGDGNNNRNRDNHLFAGYTIQSNFYVCREDFRANTAYNQADYLLLTLGYDNEDQSKRYEILIKTIRYVENYLNLLPEERLDVSWSGVENIVLIKISDWWRKYIIRFDFLTILFGCIEVFDERLRSRKVQRILIDLHTIRLSHVYFGGKFKKDLTHRKNRMAAYLLFMHGWTENLYENHNNKGEDKTNWLELTDNTSDPFCFLRFPTDEKAVQRAIKGASLTYKAEEVYSMVIMDEISNNKELSDSSDKKVLLSDVF